MNRETGVERGSRSCLALSRVTLLFRRLRGVHMQPLPPP